MSSKNIFLEDSEAEEQAELNRLFVERMIPITPALQRQKAIASRLAERVARSIAEYAGLLTVRRKDGIWTNLKKGVRVKSLWRGPEGSSVLIELAPGASLPIHRHKWLEEGIVLQGDLQIGDLELGLFDYHLSPVGSRHDRIRSRQGALAFLRGTSLGNTHAVFWELLSGMLSCKSGTVKTVFSGDEGWEQVEPGVLKKDLCSDSILTSRFFHLAPETRIIGYCHRHNAEYMIVSGEVFLGDTLLGAGEYQLAPAGSRYGEVFSDVGALLFVRGATD
jgi:hypothetical protein